MNKYYLLAVKQLLNMGAIQFCIKDDKIISVSGHIFNYSINCFKEIELLGNCSEEAFLKILNDNNLDVELLSEIKKAYMSECDFNKNIKMFLTENVKSIRDLFEYSNTMFYGITCRMICREEELKEYVLMFRNQLPQQYRIENNLKLNLFFIRHNSKNKIVKKIFNNEVPIHPLCLKSDDQIRYCKAYIFSGSHRTFFNNMDYFYKVDVPIKISSSIRYLTRSTDRINASKVAEQLNEIKLCHDKKLWVLPDIAFENINNDRTLIVRKGNATIKMFPLYALFYKINNETIFDYLYQAFSMQNILIYTINNFIKPMLEIFIKFYIISDKKFIQPYNFHRQNINVVVSSDSVIGFAVQDIDMQHDKNICSFLLEYDNCISRFILDSFKNYLINNYDVAETSFYDAVKTSFLQLMYENDLEKDLDKYPINIVNYLNKDFQINNDETHIAKVNPYR